MKVLSLFDGISCARVALDRARIPVEAYYASEIDKYASAVSRKNYQDIIRVGDVKNLWINKKWNGDTDITCLGGKVDLLIGGSPCQDLSISKRDRKGLDGEKSGLFWEYVRILRELKPKYFILENVASMPKEAKDIISRELEVEPIMINAALVSAQQRKRLFWTNIKGVILPEDKGILLRDILEPKVSDEYTVRPKSNTIRASGRGSGIDDRHNWDTIRVGKIGKGGQGDRIYSPQGKSVALSAMGGGRGAKTGLYAVPVALRNRGEGKKPEYNGTGKANSMTTVQTDSMVEVDEIIRKLTPIECERLQGLPEIEKSCIIKVCLDNQKNSVSVETQNLKLQNVVGNVERSNSQETVLSAAQSSNINSQQINNLAQPDVLILCEENKVEIHSQRKLLASVSGVELKNSHHHLKEVGDFVHLIVGLTSTVAETTPFGRVVLHQKNKCSVVVENGNNVVTLYGNEMMQLAKDVENDSITLKKLLKSTTSDHFGQANREQAIVTLFSYVASVIVGYIPKEMLNQNTLTFQVKTKVGYTYSVSNTQRYKCCGNAFNVDVVAHILSFIKKSNKTHGTTTMA